MPRPLKSVSTIHKYKWKLLSLNTHPLDCAVSAALLLWKLKLQKLSINRILCPIVLLQQKKTRTHTHTKFKCTHIVHNKYVCHSMGFVVFLVVLGPRSDVSDPLMGNRARHNWRRLLVTRFAATQPIQLDGLHVNGAVEQSSWNTLCSSSHVVRVENSRHSHSSSRATLMDKQWGAFFAFPPPKPFYLLTLKNVVEGPNWVGSVKSSQDLWFKFVLFILKRIKCLIYTLTTIKTHPYNDSKWKKYCILPKSQSSPLRTNLTKLRNWIFILTMNLHEIRGACEKLPSVGRLN